MRDTYGSAAAAWFALVGEAVNAGALGDAAPEQGLTHAPSGLSETALAAIGRGLPDISFRARMGGLQAIQALQNPQALAGFDVVMTQHLFPTTMGLVDALMVLHKEFAAYAHLAIGVEHTDRGMQQLDQMEAQGQALALPVVDMARSMAKKTFESPAIGESVVFHAEVFLRELDVQPRQKRAAVIGYGAVGKATADALRRRGYEVAVHDTDPAALARAAGDGCVVTDGDDATRRRAALQNAHVLVSATGRTTIEPKEFADLLPDGAILVNAASGTHEFGIGALGDDALTAATRPEALREDGVATTTLGGRSVATGAYTTSGKHRHLVFASKKRLN